MSTLSFFSRNPDITDRILRYLSDINTLKSTILTCKSLYSVFQAHPKSIIRAMAFNVAGAALPHALTLARRQLSSQDTSETTLDIITIDTTTVINPVEFTQLQANEEVVRNLEDLFSLRYIVA